ncbi:hypothetical protein PFFCH_04694 [Plasmodium falciparum FCH/4]|uniref:Duffy-binding-like domain-containing protein n=1 Tax=Plasmodium falciparum FCH/4 TaxID=1036724 RepID=A0A024VI78_PLAFA|nr:hypothetical protein PFFCH_04694 [Plasmodium falciparum FCH/4]
MGKGCTDCFFACNPYIDWINNQRKQFLKQKERYDNVINGTSRSSRKKRAATTSNYEGYESKFYKELQSKNVGNLDNFLELLNNEKACQAVIDNDGGKINFKEVNSGGKNSSGNGVFSGDASGTNDENKGTFYRSKYCQPCPLCGVQNKGNKEWKEKNNDNCKNIKLYTPKNGQHGTKIEILKSGEGKKDIEKKLNAFCAEKNGDTTNSGGSVGGRNSNSSLYDPWQCYEGKDVEKVKDGNDEDDEDEEDYDNDVKTGGGLCILKNENKKEQSEANSQNEPKEFQKSFHNFFYYWVAHMLKDSIYWRTKKLKGCLENGTKILCKNGCHGKCDCFLKWVGQKKKEWDKIKEHFYKQEDFNNEGDLGEGMTPDFVLEENLKSEFYKEDSEEKSAEDNQNSLDAQEAEELKHLQKILKQDEQNTQEADAAPDGKKKTIMDKLIEHEEKDAKQCIEKHTCPPPEDTSRGRSLPPAGAGDDEDEDDEEDDEEEEVENHTEEEPHDHDAECKCHENVPTSPPDACEIADAILTREGATNYIDVCKQKYDGGKKSYPGWNCNSSTFKDKEDGVCMPPRRQKLYVHNLKNLNDKTPPDQLRKAFIECASIETFFAWHKFKKDKEKKEQDLGGFASFDNEDTLPQPDDELNGGTIPEDFKRQMFYIFGDYRDLCLGKDIGSDMDAVNTNIDNVFKNDAQTDGKKLDEKRKQWWEKNAQAIWKGMLCGLSYASEKNDTVQTQLTNKYDYNNVTFKGGLDGDTKLTDFVTRTPYFRWLEEWGDEFCRKRKDKLTKVEKECDGVNENGNKIYCSGDGYDCMGKDLSHNNIYADFNCRGCEKECRNYKKWIVNKRNEFDKHRNKYKKEFQELSTSFNNEDDQKFYESLRKKGYSSVENLLASFNQGKECQGNSNPKKNTDFNKVLETFSPSTYCKACPLYGVNCGGKGGCQNNKKKVQHNTKGVSTYIPVLLNDDATKDNDEYLEQNCTKYGLYKDLRIQEWKCQYLNEVDQCNINKDVKTEYFDNEIPFNVLFERWIKDFIQDYNKSKAKISSCIKNEDERDSTCIKGCKNKCDCVEKWVDKKVKEWEKIKEHYNKQTERYIYDVAYKVKNFFEKPPFNTYAEEAKKIFDNEMKEDDIWGCTGNITCETEEKKIKYGDFIANLISELRKKIESCNMQHDKAQENCNTSPTNDEGFQEVQEDEDQDLSPAPEICKDVIPKSAKPEKPVETPMSCVEKIAKQLREKAERSVKHNDSSLKGNGTAFDGECSKLKKDDDGVNGENACNFEKTYKNSLNNINNQCEHKGMDRLKIGKNWNCVKIKKIGKYLCIPPRREHMCLDDLKILGRSTINDSSDLLKKVQQAAKHEGDDIIKNLLPENPCNENVICDAMKYSFADLGDIIRGTDLWNKNIKEQKLQIRLGNAFENIYKNLDDNTKTNYKKEIPHYYKLRSDWWDANRKEVWKAMTCNAPDASKFLKKDPNGSSGKLLSSTNGISVGHKKCGYGKYPPDYDYIPQPFRWMQEWSESFCKLLNKELDNFKNQCSDCQTNNSICTTNVEKCKSCKEQCKNYKELIDQWKNQFDKHKEIYKEIYNNKDSSKSKEYVTKFLEKFKSECKNLDTADKYLHEATQCTDYGFLESDKDDEKYAFKEIPKDFEQACKCEPPDPLDHCPNTEENKGACNNISKVMLCQKKIYNNYRDNWDSSNVEDFTGKNKGVLVPPRRRYLCLRNITSNLSVIKTKEYFKKKLIQAAYSEAYFLSEIYNKDQEKALQAMKYSFADYGDIAKGTDMIENSNKKKLNTKLDELLNDATNNNPPAYREKWWEENKQHVWHAMVCGYQKGNNYKPINSLWCTVPHEDEKTHQFMRWFREWTESFCAQRKKLYDIMVAKCKEAECDKTTGRMSMYGCTQACREYENYVFKKKLEYFGQKEKYDNEFKALNDNKDAPYYFRSTFFSKNYDCLFDNFNGDNKWKNPYESFNNDEYKEKCECKQSVIPTERKEQKTDKDPEESPQKPVPDPGPSPEKSPPKSDVLPPSQSDESSIPMNDILSTTIPFGITITLGSIAFLFIKKKSKSTVDNFIQILEIPKGDYDIPTLKSSNRYVPYGSRSKRSFDPVTKYKGKTYIYMEGDSGSDSGHYDEDTTDITSSESEYEEMDINDIYVPGSPKYKTLIEVVLEPSKRDTFNILSGETSNGDIHTNKFTDDEWNQLKQDFISQYLQNIQNDLSNEKTIDDNMYKYSHPNTLYFDNPDEKPFITSIHDRDIQNGEEVTYDINFDVPIIINRTTNTTDDPKYVSNNLYTGMDLINDSLHGNNNVDIYDELLKRKENELFGTNHTKRTTTNSVAKNTNSDPISSQLNLFHKWLDRHRDMFEQWDKNKKEKLLDKLKEEWGKENYNNSGDIHSKCVNVLNTNVSIQIDMDDPKPINEFTNMDTNPEKNTMDTIFDDMEKDREPYYNDIYDDDMIYYDVHDNEPSIDDIKMEVPNKVQIEMNVVNNKKDLLEEEYLISDIWNI